jgi:heme/copper-type cytochrome/quinol oxidase subunit 3
MSSRPQSWSVVVVVEMMKMMTMMTMTMMMMMMEEEGREDEGDEEDDNVVMMMVIILLPQGKHYGFSVLAMRHRGEDQTLENIDIRSVEVKVSQA